MTRRNGEGPASNGNDIKTALERAEQERREREIKTIEKHLRENVGEEAATSAPADTEQSAVPSKLSKVFREVPHRVAENYATKKTKKEQEKYLRNSMTAQQMQAERENREIDERKKRKE